MKFSVGNGASVRFWLDWWVGDGTFALSFPVFCSFVTYPSVSIAELAASGWDLGFRRVLSPVELEDWHRLVACALRGSGLGPILLLAAFLLSPVIVFCP